jgi:hypothetical protein
MFLKTIKTGLLTAVFITGIVMVKKADCSAQPEYLRDFWEKSYSELSQQINEHRVLGKNLEAGYLYRSTLDTHALINSSDRYPSDVILRRTEAMLGEYSKKIGNAKLNVFHERLSALKNSSRKTATLSKVALQTIPDDQIYFEAQALNREVMLAGASLDFSDIIFIERGIFGPGSEYEGEHMCDQFFGHNGRTGGGMFILKDFATNPQKVNIMNGVTVPSGTNKGKLMSTGAFLSPELSYDGKTIYFAWSSGGHDKWVQANRYNLFKINIDGTGITRLTDGNFDDMHPCCLPSGRIAFISTRRGGYGRCHERPVPSYTLCSMKSDGSDIIFLSYHETNEYHPAVLNDGRLLFTRWDYVDRDFSAAHHIWICNPDGTNPRAYHGNYATPFNTIESTGPFSDGRAARPWAEYNARAIPGSTKIIAIAGPHHGQSYGSIVLIDQDIPDDGKMSQVTRITPDARFPEAEVSGREYKYGTPWPISESLYLANYNSSLVLLDKSGNKQVLYTTTSDQNLRPNSPIPVKARTIQPNISVRTYQGERHTSTSPQATISIMNVYATDEIGKLPTNSKVKQLRIMQVLPKTTQLTNDPLIGTTQDYWGGGIARFPLGVVPVEDDGSVYFEAPVAKEIYFQLLDSNGCAIQSMRSGTYVHSGEQMSCYGCHEDKWQALPPLSNRKAMGRPPSQIAPEFADQYPFGFHRNVKPVFQNTCLPCHKRQGKGLQNMDFVSIVGPQSSGWNDQNVESNRYGFFFSGGGSCTIYKHTGSRTLPGRFGARESRMGKALLSSTHQAALKDGTIKAEDFRKVILWLDGNCDELGAFNRVADQKAGKRVWPDLDVDSLNPTGVEVGTPTLAFDNRNVAKTVLITAVFNGKYLVLKNTPAFSGQYTCEILDYFGRTVISNTSEGSIKGNELTFSINDLAHGSYIVRLISEGKTWITKTCYY